MLTKERRDQIWAMGFLALLLFAAAFGAYSGVCSQRPTEQHLDRPANDQSQTDNKADDVEGIGQSTAHSSRGDPADQSESENQEGREYWSLFAITMKITDSLLVLFTAILAAFTALLWWSTNKLWESSKEQIVAAQDAAKSAAINSDILLKTQRALMYCRTFNTIIHWSLDGVELLGIEISCSWQNAGAMPAMGVTASFRSKIIPFDSTDIVQFEFKDNPERRGRHTAPGDGFTTGTAGILLDDLIKSWDKESRILLYTGCYFDDGVSQHRTLIDQANEVFVMRDPRQWPHAMDQVLMDDRIRVGSFEGRYNITGEASQGDKPTQKSADQPAATRGETAT